MRLRLWRWVRRTVTAWVTEPDPQQEQAPRYFSHTRELRFFLVRTGEYDGPTSKWPLSSAGENQARAAGRRIKELLSGTGAIVLLDTSASQSYQQTARLIAQELGREPVADVWTYPPEENCELDRFIQLGAPAFVMVIDGSNLSRYLLTHEGPAVSFGISGPSHGSVHLLIVTYREEGIFGNKILSSRFV